MKLVVPYFTFLFLLMLAFSCNENQEIKSTKVAVSNDSLALNTIVEFYKWYNNNQNLQNCLVKNSCNKELDSTKLYAVDFEATENYLNTLKNTGYVSEFFLNDLKNYFKKCDEDFKTSPQYDGPPSGFDYDLLTNSQDFEQELAEVEKAKINSSSESMGKKILIVEFVTGNKLNFELSLSNNKWLIDMIGNTKN